MGTCGYKGCKYLTQRGRPMCDGHDHLQLQRAIAILSVAGMATPFEVSSIQQRIGVFYPEGWSLGRDERVIAVKSFEAPLRAQVLRKTKAEVKQLNKRKLP